MNKEKKNSLELLAIVAVANLVLAFVVGFFCKTMAYVYPHVFGDNTSPYGSVALVFNTFWWPWLLFTACVILTYIGAKVKTILISIFVILLIDIICLAITLFVIAFLFAMPMWELT